jgi:cation diffusion facilitator family transporter
MSHANSKKVIVAALIGNSLVFVSKLVAAVLSGSIAMVAESLHSAADTGNQLLLLLGRKLSKRPPTELHPFGFGRERFFWPFIVGVSMFTIGSAVSIIQGTQRLFNPHELGPLTATYIVLALSILFEGYSFTIAYIELRKAKGSDSLVQTIKKSKAPALIVVFLEDGAAMIGLVIALVGVAAADITGDVRFDGLASILIGIVLALVAFIIAWETKSLLIGEGLERKDLQALKDAIFAVPEVEDCYQCLTLYLAPEEVLVNCEVNLIDGLDTDQVEEVIDRIESGIRKAVPITGEIFIEVERQKKVKK